MINMRHTYNVTDAELLNTLKKLNEALKKTITANVIKSDYITNLDSNSKLLLAKVLADDMQKSALAGNVRQSPHGIYTNITSGRGMRINDDRSLGAFSVETGDVTKALTAVKPPQGNLIGIPAPSSVVRATQTISSATFGGSSQEVLTAAKKSRNCGSKFTSVTKLSDNNYGASRLEGFSVNDDVLNQFNGINDTNKVFKTFAAMPDNDEMLFKGLIADGKVDLCNTIKSTKFFKTLRLNKIAPEWFILMSKHESGLQWQRENKAGTDRVIAYGLIQFTKIGAKSVGATLEGIISMDLPEQLAAIVKFYNNLNKSGSINNFGMMKIANFMPAALTWDKSTVMFTADSVTGKQNPNTDYDKDGYVTVSDTVIRSYEFCSKLLAGKEGWFTDVVKSVLL